MIHVMAATALVVLTSGMPRSASAQWPPQRLENLQVLPEDITVRQLIGVMRGIAGGLGVRCTYCHVGEEGQPLATYDFPADDKETKEKARIMMRMVNHINGEHLADLPGDPADRLTVRCATCHRGQPRPLTLAEALTEVLDEQGADSAVARYHALRDRFYGRDTYNFGEFSLNGLGYQLLRSGRTEDAVAIFRLNAEMYPESANVHDSLGDGLKAAGMPQAALRAYMAAFELDPAMRGLQVRIDSLR
jgi:tetratricopeptide (TPR) repeat protein